MWGWHCCGWDCGSVLCWFGVWVSCWVLWVVCGCVGRVPRPWLAVVLRWRVVTWVFSVELRFLGGGRLLVGGACRQGLHLAGQSGGLGYSLLALVLLSCVQGPLWVYGGARWPKCRGPMHWARQVVLDRVVVVVGVCLLRVAPCRGWERWKGLVVVRSSAPRGVVGPWGPAVLGYGGDGGGVGLQWYSGIRGQGLGVAGAC